MYTNKGLASSVGWTTQNRKISKFFLYTSKVACNIERIYFRGREKKRSSEVARQYIVFVSSRRLINIYLLYNMQEQEWIYRYVNEYPATWRKSRKFALSLFKLNIKISAKGGCIMYNNNTRELYTQIGDNRIKFFENEKKKKKLVL